MKLSRILIVLVAGLMIAWNLPGLAQDTNAEAAQRADEAWLHLIDSGKYAESYKTAAATFQSALTEEKWVGALGTVRTPLGGLIARTLKSAKFTKTLPGVPDGEYEVMTFETRFEHKENLVETVTASREKDGIWRVSGYYIK